MLSLQESTGNPQGLKTKIWKPRVVSRLVSCSCPEHLLMSEAQRLGISRPPGAQKTRLCRVGNRNQDAHQKSKTTQLQPALAKGGDKKTWMSWPRLWVREKKNHRLSNKPSLMREWSLNLCHWGNLGTTKPADDFEVVLLQSAWQKPERAALMECAQSRHPGPQGSHWMEAHTPKFNHMQSESQQKPREKEVQMLELLYL